MRSVPVLACLVMLAACSGDPKSLGITGPGTQPAPPAPMGMDDSAMPGAPTSGTYYGPSNGPRTGASGFWGYN